MSAREWQRKYEQQQKEQEVMQKRIKDVIKAYKGLEAEKKALEEIVVAWKKEEEGGEGTEEDSGTQPQTSTSLALPAKPTIESLKTAFASLTKEKIRRESALQADKKTLLAELDTVRERLRAAEAESKDRAEQLSRAIKQAESDADKFEKLVKDQHDKMVLVKRELDMERTSHGNNAAAIQAEYAKERRTNEELNRKLAEAYTKIHEKEQAPTKLQAEIAKWKKAAEEWKEKAEKTPSVQLLQDQIANMKIAHESAVADAVRRATDAASKDSRASDRVQAVEASLQRMAAQLAAAESARAAAEEETRRARDDADASQAELDRQRTLGLLSPDPLDRLRAAVREARERRPEADLREILGGDANALAELRERHERLKDEYERYKLKAEAVLKSRQAKEETSEREGGASVEEEGLRRLVQQLHDKLRSIEIAHAAEAAAHDEETRSLRERVCDLERTGESSRSEMRRELAARIAEMEEEMSKQRERTLEVLAEKEQELEATRSILVSLRSDQLAGAPADPITPGGGSSSDRPARIAGGGKRSGEWKRYGERKTSTEVGGRRSMSSVSSIVAETPEKPEQQVSLPIGNESRNIYYEEEMSKKDREISELRSSLHQLDFRMREIEQNYLCRDLQHHEQSERLKEEIRVLEGKLALMQQSDTGSSEYLRNIFVQFLNCDSGSGRKHILKAIGTVLRLSPKEMKAVEKRNWT